MGISSLCFDVCVRVCCSLVVVVSMVVVVVACMCAQLYGCALKRPMYCSVKDIVRKISKRLLCLITGEAMLCCGAYRGRNYIVKSIMRA